MHCPGSGKINAAELLVREDPVVEMQIGQQQVNAIQRGTVGGLSKILGLETVPQATEIASRFSDSSDKWKLW